MDGPWLSAYFCTLHVVAPSFTTQVSMVSGIPLQALFRHLVHRIDQVDMMTKNNRKDKKRQKKPLTGNL